MKSGSSLSGDFWDDMQESVGMFLQSKYSISPIVAMWRSDSSLLYALYRLCVGLVALEDHPMTAKVVGPDTFNQPRRADSARGHELQVHHLTRLLACAIHFAALQQEEMKRMSRLALTDELTGLYNRRGFLFLAKQQLKIARRNDQGVILIFADVNGLKQINDTWGHAEGDRILREAADVLRQSIRDSDILARVGGDEFVILASDAGGNADRRITLRLNRIVRALSGRRTHARGSLSLSFGFSRLSGGDTRSIKDLMKQADQDMYRRKRMSRLAIPAAAAFDSRLLTVQKRRSA